MQWCWWSTMSLEVGEILLCGLHLFTFCRGCNWFLYLLAFSPHIFTIWVVLHILLCSVMSWNQLYLALKVEKIFSVICVYTSWASGVTFCLYSQGLCYHPMLAFPATVMKGINFLKLCDLPFQSLQSFNLWVVSMLWSSALEMSQSALDACALLMIPPSNCLTPSAFHIVFYRWACSLLKEDKSLLCPEGLTWPMLQPSTWPYI